MEERKGVYRILVGNLRQRDHLEDSAIYRRMIFSSNFRKCDGGAWTELIWLRIGAGDRHS